MENAFICAKVKVNYVGTLFIRFGVFVSSVSPVFHNLVAVSIGLKNAYRMMTSIL